MTDELPTERCAALYTLIDGERIEIAGQSYQLRLTEVLPRPPMSFVVSVSTCHDHEAYAEVRFYGEWLDNTPTILEQLKATIASLSRANPAAVAEKFDRDRCEPRSAYAMLLPAPR